MHDLEQRVMVGPWFEPYGPGGASVSTLSENLTERDVQHLGRILRTWEADGLLRQEGRLNSSGELIYRPTPKLWTERERYFHRLAWRKPALLNQENYDVGNLVLALLMAHKIADSRIRGVWHSSRPALRARAELCVYLFKYAPHDVNAACDRLVTSEILKTDTVAHDTEILPAIEPTVAGVVAYRTSTARTLGLSPNESILDLTKKSEIIIFWAWQADFKSSRNQIENVLKDLVEAVNRDRESVYPVRIETAVDIGDGAVRIDTTLLSKICDADILIADVTPVYRAFKRLTPNPNVLVEVGYALASKVPHEILLIEKRREPEQIPGDDDPAVQLPFDISTVHRISFTEPRDLRRRMVDEFRAFLQKKSWTSSGTAA